MLDLVPAKSGGKRVASGFHPAQGTSRMTVGLLTGCVQDGLSPRIHQATLRVLTSIGASVVVAEEGICCGALSHHLGDQAGAERHFQATASAIAALRSAGAQMIAVTAAGCGSFLKGRAAGVSDISEIVSTLGWPADRRMAAPMRLAYQSACALKHGQKIEDGPKLLLAQAGYIVLDLPEAHLCCGSAGTYNMLEPALSGALRARKLTAIQSVKPDAVASGNIGCIMQLTQCGRPIGHVMEWLDHALGGPAPV
jgi:glycolate oxidase iron-sulfur subunit